MYLFIGILDELLSTILSNILTLIKKNIMINLLILIFNVNHGFYSYYLLVNNYKCCEQ